MALHVKIRELVLLLCPNAQVYQAAPPKTSSSKTPVQCTLNVLVDMSGASVSSVGYATAQRPLHMLSVRVGDLE